MVRPLRCKLENVDLGTESNRSFRGVKHRVPNAGGSAWNKGFGADTRGQKVYQADWQELEFPGHSIHALAAAAQEPF
jgi:hypothetical protein